MHNTHIYINNNILYTINTATCFDAPALSSRSIIHLRPLGRPRRRWEDNIKVDLREVGCGCVDWMELAQDSDRWCALVSAVMNLRVP